MADLLLEVQGLTVGYGDGIVLSDMSLSLERGRSLAVLGRNGVGKSTLMLAIAGHLAPRSGHILLSGQSLNRVPPFQRCRRGIGWVPQGRDVFAPLTVEENLLIAARKGPWTMRRVHDLFPRLLERRQNYAGQLSGGEQQMLAIARALVTNPAILLLDEPLEGLAPVVAQDVACCITEVVEKEGMSAILVEQHAGFALELAHEALIIERGRVVRSGTSAQIAADRDALELHVGMRKSTSRKAG
ncbi:MULTISPECIES: ABC transporter ATP-binding protein [unclassified Bradyrhizobium]|uniref:ABC transporter ATP-binding protein n=1 Tax=unclassified Bradyrhizobium TaxID=2631580 RepID=UPI00244D32BD|nr:MULTISPECIES: ABC transporter ATP-binding protein [unclassified Bradyrhizobium]MDH2346191.1 ABC transporter ATP-binding protein [Bradyrhizobium sp. SSUT77]MDH2350436.1 ABC transporter ATP-binding protein [Bradyrhizobium sp. SSUT112]